MWLCTNFRPSTARRLRIALALKDLSPARQFIHLLKDGGQQNTGAFRAKNPLGVVPVLETDDGAPPTRPRAILEWLDETPPTPPRRNVRWTHPDQPETTAQRRACGRSGRHPRFPPARGWVKYRSGSNP
ncbi:MAG TPA: glutathione S-transferase N-terminal domain-containing protein [Acetobacteraceae bacterium]|nr:glutathione S-transferase N-terminal domain-containing protein [Acetobacteraceae bacterium]